MICVLTSGASCTQMCVEACRVIGKSVFHKGPISSSDADWLWCAATPPSLSLTHIQRSDIDSNMPPLSHSLTSWWPTETFRMWLLAEGDTHATEKAAVIGWTVAQGAEGTSQPVCYWSMWIRRPLSVGASPSDDRLLQALLGFGPWKDSQHNNFVWQRHI